MASLFRKLRREAAKPTKTLIGVYGAYDRFTLLVDGDILLVFTDDADVTNFLSRAPKLLLPKIIHPMYFEDLMQGIRMGAKYSLRREVAEKFLVAWAKMYRTPPPFTAVEVANIEEFLCLSTPNN
jgi:hypothetical protein